MTGYRTRVHIAQCGFVVGLVALAEILSRLMGHGSDLLPPPSTVLLSVKSVLEDEPVRNALIALLGQLIAAFLIAIVLGILVGYLVSITAKIERVSLPILLLLYSIPQITLLPIFILMFGIGPGSKIGFGVSHGMFPIALGVISGVQRARANPIYNRWADSLGATSMQRLIRIQIPQALGAVCVGLRLAMATTLLGVLLADIYASSYGVGYFVRLFTDTMQGAKLFAVILLLGLMAVLMNTLVTRIESYATRWKA